MRLVFKPVSARVTPPAAAVPLCAAPCGPASVDQQMPVPGPQGPAGGYTVGSGTAH